MGKKNREVHQEHCLYVFTALRSILKEKPRAYSVSHPSRPCGELSLQMFPKQMKSCWCENRAATVHRALELFSISLNIHIRVKAERSD